VLTRNLLAVAAALVLAPVAAGHVTANPSTAPADSFAVIALRVPHGCDDAPTTALSVKIPDGIVEATPQAVPGWNAEVVEGKLPQPVEMEGETITEGVKQVTWTGGPLSPHEFTDFGLSMKLPNSPGKTLYFPTVQRCAGGKTTRWITITPPGAEEPDTPAPAVELTAATGGDDDSPSSSGTAEPASSGAEATAADASGDDDSDRTNLALGLGIAGLVAGLAGLGLGLSARRRRAHA
jgi:periplasmic copper chaperone A